MKVLLFNNYKNFLDDDVRNIINKFQNSEDCKEAIYIICIKLLASKYNKLPNYSKKFRMKINEIIAEMNTLKIK
jgi:hypothetical protein